MWKVSNIAGFTMCEFWHLMSHIRRARRLTYNWVSIALCVTTVLPYRLHCNIALPNNWIFASRGKRTAASSSTSPDLLTSSMPINQSINQLLATPVTSRWGNRVIRMICLYVKARYFDTWSLLAVLNPILMKYRSLSVYSPWRHGGGEHFSVW